MKINKIKYNKQEVLDLMGEQKGDYEIILGEQKNVIQRLKADVKRLSAELEAYRNRENLITLTLRSSEEKAEERRRSVGSRSSGRAGKFISALLRKVILKGLRRKARRCSRAWTKFSAGTAATRKRWKNSTLPSAASG